MFTTILIGLAVWTLSSVALGLVVSRAIAFCAGTPVGTSAPAPELSVRGEMRSRRAEG